jgi:hypothetical protein
MRTPIQRRRSRRRTAPPTTPLSPGDARSTRAISQENPEIPTTAPRRGTTRRERSSGGPTVVSAGLAVGTREVQRRPTDPGPVRGARRADMGGTAPAALVSHRHRRPPEHWPVDPETPSKSLAMSSSLLMTSEKSNGKTLQFSSIGRHLDASTRYLNLKTVGTPMKRAKSLLVTFSALVVASMVGASCAPQAPPSGATVQPVAFRLCNFSGETQLIEGGTAIGPLPSVSQVTSSMVTPAREYFRTVSGDRLWLEGSDISGWIQLSITSTQAEDLSREALIDRCISAGPAPASGCDPDCGLQSQNERWRRREEGIDCATTGPFTDVQSSRDRSRIRTEP